MKNLFIPTRLNLQLFADGGAGGDGGTGEGGAMGVTETAAMSQQKGVKEDLSNVQYGKVTESATEIQNQTQTTDGQQQSQEDRAKIFEDMIKGDYKDLYNQRVQDTVQKRLKGTKETVDRYNALQPAIELLSNRYGVDVSDIEALSKAIEEDDSYYEEEALEKGITVEELKNIKRINRENESLRRQLEEQNMKENGARLMADWMHQGEEVKSIYPSFDLEAEMQNPQFIDLLRNRIDVRTAYEVLHKDDIIPAAMQFASKTAERKVINNIRANGLRPNENGMASQSAAVVKSDVSQLTKADRQEIARRVAQGENITF